MNPIDLPDVVAQRSDLENLAAEFDDQGSGFWADADAGCAGQVVDGRQAGLDHDAAAGGVEVGVDAVQPMHPLVDVLPSGVCDYSRPGPAQNQNPVAWRDYGDR